MITPLITVPLIKKYANHLHPRRYQEGDEHRLLDPVIKYD